MGSQHQQRGEFSLEQLSNLSAGKHVSCRRGRLLWPGRRMPTLIPCRCCLNRNRWLQTQQHRAGIFSENNIFFILFHYEFLSLKIRFSHPWKWNVSKFHFYVWPPQFFFSFSFIWLQCPRKIIKIGLLITFNQFKSCVELQISTWGCLSQRSIVKSLAKRSSKIEFSNRCNGYRGRRVEPSGTWGYSAVYWGWIWQ